MKPELRAPLTGASTPLQVYHLATPRSLNAPYSFQWYRGKSPPGRRNWIQAASSGAGRRTLSGAAAVLAAVLLVAGASRVARTGVLTRLEAASDDTFDATVLRCLPV
jgi:hypothetical protein